METLKKVFAAIGKVFFGMHFWVPLVYTIVFIIFSALSGTIVENWGFYFMGLSISFIFSSALIYRAKLIALKGKSESKPEETGEKKKIVYVVPPESEGTKESQTIIIEKDVPSDKKPEIAPAVNIKKEVDSAMDSQTASAAEASSYGYISPSNRYEPAKPNQETPSPYAEAENIPPIDEEKQQARINENDLYSGFSGYLSPHEPIPTNKEPFGKDQPAKPKVYRTRTDPSIVIYDYPDKTEKYKIMQDGSLSLIAIDKKL